MQPGPGTSNKWFRLFDEEEDWLELAAHVRCMEKQLWKWKCHEVKALFDSYFSEDKGRGHWDEDAYEFPYSSQRTSVKRMPYFCLTEAVECLRINKRRPACSREDGT